MDFVTGLAGIGVGIVLTMAVFAAFIWLPWLALTWRACRKSPGTFRRALKSGALYRPSAHPND